MPVNSCANSVILILFAFSDNLSAENSKLSAESGLPGLSLLESMVGTGGPEWMKVDAGECRWTKVYAGWRRLEGVDECG